MATRTIANGGGNWSALATWVEGVVPTSADDVVATATSGNLTLDVTGNCQSIDFTNYGTHTFAMGIQTLNIGSASGGKLLLLSTMTFSFTGNGATNQINFVATTTNGGVGWPITTGTQTIPVCNFSGIGGAWTFQDDFNVTIGASGTLTHSAGTLNCNNKNWSAWSFSTGNSTKVLNMGSGTYSGKSNGGAAPWNATGTNTTINAQTSIIDCTGAGTNIFQGGSKTYNTVKFSAGGNKSINGTNVFANLTFTGSAGKTDSLSLSSNQTVTGILTLAGNSAINRALVQSTTIGTQMTITNTGATQTWRNVDFQDIALSTLFDASAITGNSGDCGGNSNITFTTPASQTHTASAGGNWSDVTKWTSRVPLPQDPVIIDSNTTGTITADMPRLGASINFTGFAGTWSCPTTFGANGLNIYGSLTLVNTMTRTGNGQWFFCGRGTHTLTTAGLSSVGSVTFRAVGGSYSMQDAWNELADITVQDGTFNLNGFDLTCTQFVAQSGRTTVINPGTNTITVTSTANVVVFNVNTANTTFNGSSATIVVSTASTNARSVSFKDGTSVGTITYTVASSPGALNLFGAAAGTITLGTINAASARGVQIQSSMFWNITNWNVNGVNNGYLYLPGVAANYASAPNAAPLQIIGNITMEAKISLATWVPATIQDLISKRDDATHISWRFFIDTAGKPNLTWSTDGTTSTTVTSSAATGFAANSINWVRVTMNVANPYKVRFWTSPDGSTWTQLGTDQNGAAGTSIFNSTSVLEIGATTLGTQNMMTGPFYEARMYNSDLGSGSGTAVFDANFTTKAFGANSFTESSANAATVTINGSLAQAGDGRIALTSSTNGVAATLSKSGGTLSSDYITVQDNTGAGTIPLYAGANGVLVSNTTNWLATAPPSGTPNLLMMGVG